MRSLAAAAACWLLVRGAAGLHSAPGVGPRLPGRWCGGGWREFSPGTPLDTTQVVSQPARPRPFGGFRPGSPYQGVFLSQEPRFAFCTIEKNGCSAWTTVLHKILVNSTLVNKPRPGVAQLSFGSLGPAAAEQIFSDPAAVRAVMVRDPLARFASVFLDKCFSRGCTNPYCLPRGKQRKGLPISFQLAVRWFLSADPRKLDGHWRLQSEHCELKDRVHEYTVVGFMDKDTFARDAACILKRAGLSRFNDDGEGRPFFLEGQEGVHQQVQGHDEEEDVLKKLYTKEAAWSIMSHMRQDYEVFHMKEPRWIQEATGEWFARVPRTCDMHDLDRPQPEAAPRYSTMMREDDVPSGARLAGYFG